MYLFSYFKNDCEALHLALSQDGLHFTPLNRNEPVVHGTVGTKTMRDPFVMRGQDGRFHLLTTDGWASTQIVYTYSEDLVRFAPQRLLPVMDEIAGARNAWAPECYFDREAKQYRLIWSSTVRQTDPPGLPTSIRDHRIWSTTTADFVSFEQSCLFFDPEHNVIDAAVAPHETGYLMAYKDERGDNSMTTDHKDILIAQASRGEGPFKTITAPISPRPVEGPSLLRRQDDWLLYYDFFMPEQFAYGVSISRDGKAWRALPDDAFDMPEGARHGSVLKIPNDTAERLLAAWR